MKAILVTTEYRGVFYGLVDENADLTEKTISLIGARCAIRFGTQHGVAELAATGPTKDSKIGSRADLIALHGVTAIWSVTDAAREKWEAA